MAEHLSGMRGWTDLGSDVSWDDYGGKWGRAAKDGSWFVVRFENMYDACSEGECKRNGQAQYIAETLRVNLPELTEKQIKSALDCVGQSAEDLSADPHVRGAQLTEACVAYGFYEPLDTFSGDVYPARLRAQARRAAEALMRDASALETARERPVNRIGSTAAEYGRGDLDSALFRDDSPEKALLRKIQYGNGEPLP
jgi:hypothetical protein